MSAEACRSYPPPPALTPAELADRELVVRGSSLAAWALAHGHGLAEATAALDGRAVGRGPTLIRDALCEELGGLPD